jgi:hypothetical protein
MLIEEIWEVLLWINTVSRVHGSVTNNNGFCIGWSDLLALLLQLQPIMTAHNQWLSKTCSIPLLDECLLFHCDDWRMKNLLQLNSPDWTSFQTNEYKSSPTVHVLLCYWCFGYCHGNVFGELLASNRLLHLFVVMGTCSPSHCLEMDVRSGSTIPALGRHVTIDFWAADCCLWKPRTLRMSPNMIAIDKDLVSQSCESCFNPKLILNYFEQGYYHPHSVSHCEWQFSVRV